MDSTIVKFLPIEIGLDNILSWLVTAGIATAVFLFFQRHQIRIARHSIVRNIEEDISEILSAKTAQVLLSNSPKPRFDEREFRAVLDNEPPWTYVVDPKALSFAGLPSPEYQFIAGQRFWLIQRQNEANNIERYLASQSLQESLLWFKRICRAYRDSVIKSVDLTYLWRSIVPFGFAGRLDYYSNYFGASDIEAMVFIIVETLNACCQKKSLRPLQYFKRYVTLYDLSVLEQNKNFRAINKKISRLVT